MTNPANAAPADASTNDAVAQGGAYEVLRKRLADQGVRLRGIDDALNARRLQEFGDSKMEIAGRFRIRSEQNAVGRDIVQVGDLLLFGYNVFLGLKSTTSVADVFGQTGNSTVVIDSDIPAIISFVATNVGGNDWQLTGSVTDDDFEGLTVTFGGLTLLLGQTCTVNSTGTFSLTTTLTVTGFASAVVTDWFGQTSTVVLTLV